MNGGRGIRYFAVRSWGKTSGHERAGFSRAGSDETAETVTASTTKIVEFLEMLRRSCGSRGA